jgi:hypothetical protein
MKTLLIIIIYFILFNINFNLLIIINYFCINIFFSPLKQLIYLIYFILFITINILTLKQIISLNLIILIIIFISGILIIFSYFICLINKISKKKNLYKLIFLNILIFSFIIIQFTQIKIILKNYNFNFFINNKINIIKKLYLSPNYRILSIFIIFLIIILFIISKICYIKNKNLRSKKWKK